MKKNYLFTLIFILLFSFSYSATYYVATAANGGSNGNTGTEASPWLTLAYAVSQASSGDTIIIGPGTYSSDAEITINFPLTIQGHGRDETIFDGTSSEAAEGFLIITADDVTVSNMTIQNYTISTGSESGGAAIRIGAARGVDHTSTPIDVDITDIKFYKNNHSYSTGEGGAIQIVSQRGNTYSTVDVRRSLFYDNTSTSRGGAAQIEGGNITKFYNTVMVDNSSAYGGAIYQREESSEGGHNYVYLINCTLYRNTGTNTWSGNAGNVYSYTNNTDRVYIMVINSIVMYGKNANGWSKDLSTGSYNYYYAYLIDSYTRYHTQVDYMDNFSTAQEYTAGGTWPGIAGGDKRMHFDFHDIDSDGVLESGDGDYSTTSAHAIGKAGQSSDLNSSWLDTNSANWVPSVDVNGVTRPQGSGSDIGAYEYRNTWDGSESTDWGTAANWTLNTVPSSTSAFNSPKIPASQSAEIDGLTVSNFPVISTDVEIANLKIDNGASITISKTGSLKVTNDFINNGTLTMQSDSENFSSLIVQGNAYGESVHEDDGTVSSINSGNITYQRYVADEGTDEWDFIGSPVEGQDLQSLIDNNSSLATNSSLVAIGPYDNSASNGDADTSNFYTYYNTTGNSGTTLPVGKGYVMATDEGSTDATVNFTGPVVTENIYYAITNATSSNTNYGKFNLVANPYTSFINANSNTGGTNFITVNSDAGNLLSGFVYVYGYDGDGTFTYYNNTSSALRIAPGQGFFVASKVGGASLQFTKAMQTNTGSDDFISGDVMENTEVVIKLFNDDNELDSTKLFFEEGLSLGLDDGYDAGSFDQNSPIMTRLIEEDEGYGMAINAMGLDAMENAVIPLVINQSAGQEFRINLFTATIPDPNVYLEDVEEGTFTNLYEEDFVYTPTSDLEGVGRFFIHMSADTMSSGEVSTSMLNAYKEIDASYITIEGLATQTNETNVSLYNILGRKVLSTTLNNNMGTQTISTVGLSTGIYVIELESGTDRLTKKLLIQ